MEIAEKKAGKYLKGNKELIIDKVMKNLLKMQKKHNLKIDKNKSYMYKNGVIFHLLYLSESLVYSEPELFLDALNWGKIYMPSIKIPTDHITMTLTVIKNVLEEIMPDNIRKPAIKYIEEGIYKMDSFNTEIDSFLEKNETLKKESKKYLQLLLDNDRMGASRLITALVDKGVKIQDIYLEIFQNTQYELGRLWHTGIISVAQEHYCTASTQLIMSQLYPYIFQNHKKENVFVGACVSDELHEIGIRMLSDILELNGWDTYYLGANTPVDSIIKTILDNNAKLLGLSATMTYHVEKIEQQIEAIRKNMDCRDVKIIVGGYVFNLSDSLWKKIGADGYGKDISDSLVKINNLTH